MRFTAIALTALVALSAGCASDDEAPGPTTDTPAPMDNATAPAPLHFEGEVPYGFDPFNVVPVQTPVGGGVPCSTSASTCFVHAFTVNGTNVSVSLEATLAWTLPASDFDLYLYEGEEQLSQDGINSLPPTGVPEATQVLRHDGLAAGEYAFWVVAWNAVGDEYTLDVTFS
jgi:hypothetical protein